MNFVPIKLNIHSDNVLWHEQFFAIGNGNPSMLKEIVIIFISMTLIIKNFGKQSLYACLVCVIARVVLVERNEEINCSLAPAAAKCNCLIFIIIIGW
jgi:hypothetical protein